MAKVRYFISKRSVGEPRAFVFRSDNGQDMGDSFKELSAKEGKARMKENARLHLLKRLKPGDTIYTFHRRTPTTIELCIVVDGRIERISAEASRLLDKKWNDTQGGIVYRSGFANDAVYDLGRALFPDGCNVERLSGTVFEKDGGYAFRQQEL